jgi:branched-chain amino acid transport system permease protein
MLNRLRDAFLTALVAFVLALPLAGARTVDGLNGLVVEWHVGEVAIAAGLIFLGRLVLGLIADGYDCFVLPGGLAFGIASLYFPFPTQFLKTVAVAGGFVLAGKAALSIWRHCRKQSAAIPALTAAVKIGKNLTLISCLVVLFTLVFPFTPIASRYALDVAIMVMTYVMLAWGLNITVGYAGLLDLGYAGFYALGAYSYALLAQHTGIGFWMALPIAGAVAAGAALLLGLPVLRLRGDYFAIVTLGFGEIVRLVLINWTDFTGGPNGISDIPRPTLFGLEFAREASEGHKAFHDFFNLAFDPVQRVIFLYYIIFGLALFVGVLSSRLRRSPLGRAWEAYREDEIACASLGINRTRIKLAAYSLGATMAGLAGAFFAARQGFISPESFTFTESATMLAIVILGGIGHPLGIVFAAVFIIGMPELFRELEQYRMLAFGVGLVLIMIWRPGGMMAQRQPTIRLGPVTL